MNHLIEVGFGLISSIGHFLVAGGQQGLVLATAVLGWASSDLSGQPVKRGQSSKVVGGLVREFAQTWSKVAGDGDGSIYYLAAIPADAVLTSLLLNNAALAGCTSASLGLYKLNNDGTISDNALSTGLSAGALLMSAVDINGGKAIGSEQNGLAALAITDLGKKVWELLGYTNPTLKNDTYVIGLLLTTAGSAAGALGIRGRYIQG